MPCQEILIVGDEIKIAAVLKDYLVKAGYSVSCLDRGDTVVPRVRKSPPGVNVGTSINK